MTLIGQPVTILGAGVAGLALARALAMRGACVTVLEQADVISEVGAGLQISPNGACVLAALGLSLDGLSIRAEAVELRDGFDDSCVLRLDLARLRPDLGWHFVHRADLINLLANGAREVGVDIRLLTKIDRVDLSGDRPKAITTQGLEIEAPLMVGADGLHSPTRMALTGITAPFFTHQVAWRALLPASSVEQNVTEVHMGYGRHLVSYPLRGGTLRNIVAVEERRRWVEEGWTLHDDPMELRLAFESFSPRVRGWLDQVSDVWLWGLFCHPVAKRWHAILPKGAMAILGDAAHPTLPFLAQGANMALEDAWTLADVLSASDTPAAALLAYQTMRAPRTAKIVEAANASARAYHLSGPTRSLAHTALRICGKLAPDLVLRRFDYIYNHDVTAQNLSSKLAWMNP